MAFIALPLLRPLLMLWILQKMSTQEPHCVFGKVIHDMTVGPELPTTNKHSSYWMLRALLHHGDHLLCLRSK